MRDGLLDDCVHHLGLVEREMTKKQRRLRVRLIHDHLALQGRRSIGVVHGGRETCMYRGPDGMMCAVGALITDNNYGPHLEGLTVTSGGRPHVKDAIRNSTRMKFSAADWYALARAQLFHDTRGRWSEGFDSAGFMNCMVQAYRGWGISL